MNSSSILSKIFFIFREDYYDSIDACENRKPSSLLTSGGVIFLGAVGYRTINHFERENQIIAGPYICQQGCLNFHFYINIYKVG
jgi:hypothetical protein